MLARGLPLRRPLLTAIGMRRPAASTRSSASKAQRPPPLLECSAGSSSCAAWREKICTGGGALVGDGGIAAASQRRLPRLEAAQRVAHERAPGPCRARPDDGADEGLECAAEQPLEGRVLRRGGRSRGGEEVRAAADHEGCTVFAGPREPPRRRQQRPHLRGDRAGSGRASSSGGPPPLTSHLLRFDRTVRGSDEHVRPPRPQHALAHGAALAEGLVQAQHAQARRAPRGEVGLRREGVCVVRMSNRALLRRKRRASATATVESVEPSSTTMISHVNASEHGAGKGGAGAGPTAAVPVALAASPVGPAS